MEGRNCEMGGQELLSAELRLWEQGAAGAVVPLPISLPVELTECSTALFFLSLLLSPSSLLDHGEAKILTRTLMNLRLNSFHLFLAEFLLASTTPLQLIQRIDGFSPVRCFVKSLLVAH